jgi:hypothetical protein
LSKKNPLSRKISFRTEREVKKFSDEEKLRQFVTAFTKGMTRGNSLNRKEMMKDGPWNVGEEKICNIFACNFLK